MALTGVFLSLTSDTTMTTAGGMVSWDAAVQYNGTFWASGSPTRITIPSGIDMMQFWWGGRVGSTISSHDTRIQLQRDGSALGGYVTQNSDMAGIGFTTGIMGVTASEYFENYIRSYDADHTWESAYSYFAAFTADSVIGHVKARPTSPLQIASTAATVSFDTPLIDTFSSHNGTTGFVVPPGAVYAAPAVNMRFASASTGRTYFRAKVNGTVVRMVDSQWSEWGAGHPLGPIPVSPGDLLTFDIYHAATKDILEVYAGVSIEWLGYSDGVIPATEPQDVYTVNMLAVVETPPETQFVYTVNMLAVVEAP